MGWLSEFFMRKPTADDSERTLVSGTWYTPSATRPTLVTIWVHAGSITGGDSAAFQVEKRDGADVQVWSRLIGLARDGTSVGNDAPDLSCSFIVQPGYDYRVVNNSVNATGVTMFAEEVTL